MSFFAYLGWTAEGIAYGEARKEAKQVLHPLKSTTPWPRLSHSRVSIHKSVLHHVLAAFPVEHTPGCVCCKGFSLRLKMLPRSLCGSWCLDIKGKRCLCVGASFLIPQWKCPRLCPSAFLGTVTKLLRTEAPNDTERNTSSQAKFE